MSKYRENYSPSNVRLHYYNKRDLILSTHDRNSLLKTLIRLTYLSSTAVDHSRRNIVSA